MSVRDIFTDRQAPIYIIAEIGVNHNGDMDLALKSVDEAVRCGASAVKFQTFRSDKLVSKHAPKAQYQIQNTMSSNSQLEMLKQLELSFEDFTNMQKYCAGKGIDFLSTPFDEESADFLHSISIDAFKIGSGDMNNIPFLKQINRYGLPVLLSTGMAELDEIRAPLAALENCGVALLHCTSDYPAPLQDVNLAAMDTLKRTYGRATGYSDHTDGIEIAIAAAAIGAKIIEKHFTLDRSLPGPDHAASLEPDQFTAMVKAIRNVEMAKGDGIKRCMPSEKATRAVARKSLIIARNLSAGHVLTGEDIAVKRPGTGIEPGFYEKLIGRKLMRDMERDELIRWEDLM
ncbi:N-acetylneuraminate synthase [Paenibacillus zanthoxyli]|uniref:N-acetylneuraminate synthase n=1 Tax=Paenibacillus zanthoxyli TaxID=369399 RepID=UPI00047149AE|nr:N-acetylneuraminate synthase [Paenibacillus zanthoxyli]